MKAIDTMIVWIPNRELYDGKPNQGDIQLTTIPEPPELKAYSHSVGACDANWKSTDENGRVELAQKYFSQMVHSDRLDADLVEGKFRQIDEFHNVSFDRSKPTGDDWQ